MWSFKNLNKTAFCLLIKISNFKFISGVRIVIGRIYQTMAFNIDSSCLGIQRILSKTKSMTSFFLFQGLNWLCFLEAFPIISSLFLSKPIGAMMDGICQKQPSVMNSFGFWIHPPLKLRFYLSRSQSIALVSFTIWWQNCWLCFTSSRRWLTANAKYAFSF